MRRFVILLCFGLAACATPPAETGATDADGDGSAATVDCDDGDAGIHPGAAELCDGIDQDCDGTADNGLDLTWFQDADGDGYGVGAQVVRACAQPAGFADNQDDCDDASAQVNPGAAELCNLLDDNCDGRPDEAVGTWFTDADGDGYGDPGTEAETCTPGEGAVQQGEDCDDGDSTVNPGVAENCDGLDTNCDGRPDAGVLGTWYSDADADGYGNPYDSKETCDPPAGWVEDGDDCRPSEASGHPGAAELCNSVDDDCDGEKDEDFDLDGDGHWTEACDGDDCDDGDARVNPGVEETCEDGIDNDCDGRDAHCAFDGTLEASVADAKLYSPGASADAGRMLLSRDVDGDGNDDLMVAAQMASGYRGAAYVALGPFTTGRALDDDYTLSPSSSSYAGRSIGIGDVDGDGELDFAVGAPDGTEKEWVAFGPLTGDVDLDHADIEWSGTYGAEVGHGSEIADVNGDGVDDVVIGAYEDPVGAFEGGAIYLEYGPLAAGDYSLSTSYDVRILASSPYEYAGRYLRAGADVDGDGIGDILTVAPYSSMSTPYGGGGYLFYGGLTSDVHFTDADATFLGETANDYAGEELAMGDYDGDGRADIALGSYGNASGTYVGTAYITLAPPSASVDLGSTDFVVRGSTASDQFGLGLTIADIDEDGAGDLLVGAIGASHGGVASGSAYLFFGPPTGSFSPSDAEAVFTGESAGDQFGEAFAVGDFDGDGHRDVAIGAVSESTGGSGGGSVYVFAGN